MDLCPTEVLAQIFLIACSYDHRTYSALSAVSKYVHLLVRPFQYHTLAITGSHHAAEVSTKLASTRTDSPIHLHPVRHLFLSDHDSTTEKPTTTISSSHILRILSLAAPTLHTLTFHTSYPSSSTSLISGLFSIVFPHLTHLTVIGFYPFPRIPCSLPQLITLRLRGNRNPHGLLHTDCLRIASPNLTHLHISGLSMAVSFVDELADALAIGDAHMHEDHDNNDVDHLPRLPPNLRNLFIQPAVALDTTIPGRFKTSGVKDKRMMDRLSEIASYACSMSPTTTTTTNGVNVIVFERDEAHSSPHYSHEWARREWARPLDHSESKEENQ